MVTKTDSQSRTRHWLVPALAAVPCFYLSWVLFGVWAQPMARDDGSWVRFGVGLLLLEFVLLHSGFFMASLMHSHNSTSRKAGLFLVLTCFYGLFAWSFAQSLESPALLWIFTAVVLGRLMTAVTGPEVGIESQKARSALGVALYIAVVSGTIFLPIPEWGITPEVLAEVYPQRGSGIWQQQPHRAIAGAAVYFLALGLAEVLIFSRAGQGKRT